MYNKAKHLTGKIAAICMVVLGSLLLAYEAYFLITTLIDEHSASDSLAVLNAFVNLLFFTRFPIRLVLGIVSILVGIKNIRKPIYREYMHGNSSWLYVPLKLSVIFLILCGILLYLGYYDVSLTFVNHVKLNGGYYSVNTLFKVVQWFQLAAAFVIMVLKIVSLCLRSTVENVQADPQEETQDAIADADDAVNE